MQPKAQVKLEAFIIPCISSVARHGHVGVRAPPRAREIMRMLARSILRLADQRHAWRVSPSRGESFGQGVGSSLRRGYSAIPVRAPCACGHGRARRQRAGCFVVAPRRGPRVAAWPQWLRLHVPRGFSAITRGRARAAPVRASVLRPTLQQLRVGSYRDMPPFRKTRLRTG